ncbi:MAG: hypothetical protein CHACPFDD_01386 [Phycisphaerae bacterium]|nr:hypothetical protein [Phycisphaerae bacterium]
MATTLTRILLHITFSTKHRAKLIPTHYRDDLYAYMGGICRNHDSVLLAAGGTDDHVHLFVNLGKTVALSTLMLELKRDTSKWMKSRGREFAVFAWQDGYFAFSIGQSGADKLRAYIAGQPAHHHALSFQDEVRAVLRKYGLQLDERYAWD